MGSLLWSNFGVTQNVFAGTIVNMTNGNVEVQGWGETKFSDQTIYAPNQLLLAVSGTAATATLAARFTLATTILNGAAGAVIGVVAALVAAQTGVTADTKRTNAELAETLQSFKTDMWVLTGAVAALQIAGTALGIVLARAAIPAAGYRILNDHDDKRQDHSRRGRDPGYHRR